MRSRTPTIHCDGDDGSCGAWEVDHYETCASTVNGVPITREHRAPGWTSTNLADFCPTHTIGGTHSDHRPLIVDFELTERA